MNPIVIHPINRKDYTREDSSDSVFIEFGGPNQIKRLIHALTTSLVEAGRTDGGIDNANICLRLPAVYAPPALTEGSAEKRNKGAIVGCKLSPEDGRSLFATTIPVFGTFPQQVPNRVETRIDK